MCARGNTIYFGNLNYKRRAKEMNGMRKLLLVLIFFILNTIGSFGEPSNWETLKWISENVEKYSKGMEEYDTWNGGSKLAYIV